MFVYLRKQKEGNVKMKKLLLAGSMAATLIFSATSPVATNEPVTAHAASKYYFKNNVAKLTDVKIKITKVKIIKPGQKGNEYGKKKIIAFWYTTTNLSGKSMSPIAAWSAVFNAYQSTSSYTQRLSAFNTPDRKHYDTQFAKIKKGKSLSNSISYELINSKPVTLKAHKGIGGAYLGKKVYKVK